MLLLYKKIKPISVTKDIVINIKFEPLMFKLVLEKAEEPEIKLPTSAGS